MSTRSVVRPWGFKKAFSYTRRRGALWLRAALAVPLAVAPLVVGLTPGGITQVAAVGPPCGNGVLTTTVTTSTCTYTNAGQDTFTVPPGVTTLHVVAVGGKGGDGGSGDSVCCSYVPSPGGRGGAGAVITTDIPAMFGTILYVEVGANGSVGASGTGSYTAASGGAGGAGGSLGGGSGGAGAAPSMSTGGGGGGGGESDVRTCSTAGPPACPLLTAAAGDPRRVVAAGGAGGGGGADGFMFSSGGRGGAGGVAGDATVTGSGKGGDGGCCAGFDGANGGSGAGGGGAGMAFGCQTSRPGDLGLPGSGGSGGADSCGGGGGGGGGGFFGGGGGGPGANIGGGGGGGGGSSFGPTGSTVATDTTGAPKVSISFTVPVSSTCNDRDGEGDIEAEHHTGKDDPMHLHQAHFQMDQDSCEDHAPEHVDMEDPDSGTKFHSTHIDSVSFSRAASALTITGTGLDNGVPVTFSAVAVDNGATALDTFSIVLSDGYHNAGHLLGGTITLH